MNRKIDLADDELVLLDGRCLKRTQSLVDDAAARLAAVDDLPHLTNPRAGFVADAERRAAESGKLTWTEKRIHRWWPDLTFTVDPTNLEGPAVCISAGVAVRPAHASPGGDRMNRDRLPFDQAPDLDETVPDTEWWLGWAPDDDGPALRSRPGCCPDLRPNRLDLVFIAGWILAGALAAGAWYGVWEVVERLAR